MYDCIVIGAGIAGAACARKLAEEAGKKVLVIERRNHVGGNCYDVLDEYGILIHEYGPHIFHTGLEEVYEYLSRFTEWYPFGHEVVAKVGNKLIPVPFNLNTLHMVYDKEKADLLEKKLIEAYGEGSRVPIMKLRENDDPDIREIAQYVYENVFLKYTMKQWGQKPEEISPEVTGRVPVLISYDNRYFQDKYQGVPKDGFTPMFEHMLDHENIEVVLDTDCRDVLKFTGNEILFEGKPFEGVHKGLHRCAQGLALSLGPAEPQPFCRGSERFIKAHLLPDDPVLKAVRQFHLLGHQCVTVGVGQQAALSRCTGKLPFCQPQHEHIIRRVQTHLARAGQHHGVQCLGDMPQVGRTQQQAEQVLVLGHGHALLPQQAGHLVQQLHHHVPLAGGFLCRRDAPCRADILHQPGLLFLGPQLLQAEINSPADLLRVAALHLSAQGVHGVHQLPAGVLGPGKILPRNN